ncbi:acyl-CoA thioesterase [Qipengyuania sphaerica]|uniref:acyl-CoA thioesterase n=1 Tax=Qipengyuania sphaerica TaxID=2867243 RepID=UPI001C87E50F|nr:acyl-CoA thioesterase [Qipengyuania sphaerica]MBX7539491.1 acyl-CoA thioesterase [Qipengyuania sphaerica]
MTAKFEQTFTARPEHIDELGHVNNTVWVRWIQDLAVAHWEKTAAPDHSAQFFWVVTRHEIDYRGNVAEGETVTGETWIEGTPRGATSTRRVDFRNEAGKVIVSAATTWAMLDRETQRLVRVRPEVLAPFT